MPRGLSRARRPPVRTGKRGAEHTDCAPARKGPRGDFHDPSPIFPRSAASAAKGFGSSSRRQRRRWRRRASRPPCADRRAGRGRAPRSRRGRGRCGRRAARPRRPRRDRRRARRRGGRRPPAGSGGGRPGRSRVVTGSRVTTQVWTTSPRAWPSRPQPPSASGERRPAKRSLRTACGAEEPGERGGLLGGRGDVEVEAVERR